MVRIMICGIASCLMLGPAQGQRSQIPELTQEQADSRTVIGVANEYLAAGAEAIRVKQYDEGIRLTKIGLDRPASPRDRSAALSNLCAAHAAKNEPDLAIGYCNESHRNQRRELACVQQPRVRVLLEAHVRRSRCGPRRSAVDQPGRQADAADPRHDERAPPARARHDRGAQLAVPPRHVVAAIVAVGFALAAQKSDAARGDVDPVGTWSCVVWGHPDFGDESVLFHFAPQGIARLARIEAVPVPAWTELTPWIMREPRDEVRRSTNRTAVHGQPASRHSRRQPGER